MKYWIGYLTAAIVLACNWALREFAAAHTVLVDMIYPYVSRMAQSFLNDWSSGVSFCMWQALLLVLLTLLLVSIIMVLVFHWNPIRWFGWVCTVAAALVFLNTCLYGLNAFSGPLSEDIRLEETSYNISELEQATIYFRDQANAMAEQVERTGNGDVSFGEFEDLALVAVENFEDLVYEHSLSVFAGPMTPVKKLGWEKLFTARGVTGVTVGFTGEAAVNPQTPPVMLPFAMCREMARRTSITVERDASFAGYMGCMVGTDPQFRYSGALLGYRYCLKALEALQQVMGTDVASQVRALESEQVKHDLAICDEFYGDREMDDALTCELLTSWHIQEIVLPALMEEETPFDPMDKSQVDLSDHPDA